MPDHFGVMDEHSNIDIDIVERDGVVVVVVQGEVDLYVAPEFEESLARAGASQAPSIVVDLDRVDFMDSAGVHVLLQFCELRSQRHPPGADPRLAAGAAAARGHRRAALPTVRALAGAPARLRLPGPPPARAGYSSSSASFSVWLGRIAAATLSGSGR